MSIMSDLLFLASITADQIRECATLKTYNNLRVPTNYVENDIQIKSILYYLTKLKKKLLELKFENQCEYDLTKSIVCYITAFEHGFDHSTHLLVHCPDFHSYFEYFYRFYGTLS